jgi:hypothetical protein
VISAGSVPGSVPLLRLAVGENQPVRLCFLGHTDEARDLRCMLGGVGLVMLEKDALLPLVEYS